MDSEHNDLEKMIRNISSVCRDVKNINDKYDMLYSYTGKNFNIFSILGIEEREVYICRVICDLLASNGNHGQKNLYLKLFCEHVLKSCNIKINEEKFGTTNVVTRESQTKNGRRIDIVLDTEDTVIGIEVKINAGDQNKQLEDYWLEISNRAELEHKEPYLLYLTKFGDLPSDESLGALKSDAVKLISFKTHIVQWLNACLTHQRTIEMASVREIIKQLISTVKKITNQLEDDENMEIENLLMSNDEYFKTICKCFNSPIMDTMQRIKVNIACEIFKGIEDIMQEGYYKMIKVGRHYRERGDEQFNNLSYCCDYNGGNIGNKYFITVSFEISLVTKGDSNKHNAMIGYLIHDKNEKLVFPNTVRKEFKDELSKFETYIGEKFPANCKNEGYLWLASECDYLNGKAPDFCNWNDAYIELCINDNSRNIFIQKCAEKMKELIKPQ